jgi:vacuolar-type H+-ATPase subunit I/STV1
MSTQKLTQEELNQINQLRTQQSEVILSLGQLEYQLFILEREKQKLKSKLEDLEIQSEQAADNLTAKYGPGSINLETGEITSN